MARQIYEYILGIFDDNEFDMPAGAEISHIDNQNGRICLWAQVDTNQPTHLRSFFMAGTGQDIPQDAKYIGTAQLPPRVWHVFERP